MRENLLEILQCTYCGSSLDLEAGAGLRRHSDEITTGILRCHCATYPVVDGIPVMLAGYGGDAAFQRMLSDDPELALFVMLELDEERQVELKRILAKTDASTYQELVTFFCPGPEGLYYVHRLSNPTYVVGQAVLRAVSAERKCFTRRAIDLCGGSGHLTRTLCELSGDSEVVLTETNFWKLWLARRAMAPRCAPVYCDAESPLPFKSGSFSFALCSDAFHYIWSKRLFACEMMRLVGDDGVIILNHVHNALQENYSAGLPLAPKWWRNLLAEMGARVFKESELLNSVIEHRTIDLSHNYSDDELSDEQALFLIATRLDGLFRAYKYPDTESTSGLWRINPLYEVKSNGSGAVLRLQFPPESYEDEYKACKRYLPERIELTADELSSLTTGELNGSLRELADRYVLLNVPRGYL